MLQFGQITALGTVVFTAVLILRNISAFIRLQKNDYGDPKGAARTRLRAESAIVTQLVAWTAGVLAVYLLDWLGFRGAFSLGGKDLAKLAVGQKIAIGLMASSTLSTVNELKKAFDNTDSARAPSLLGIPILPDKPSSAPLPAAPR
jgi:hypothetical protein